jgi:histone acetyltransferase (RNA polymerase elongator complex component)
MSECKHGMRSGCVYCHGDMTPTPSRPSPKKRTKASRLSEQMNERMTTLKRRLRQLRGE